MKKLVFSSLAAALLVFSGCSDKEPIVDAPAEEVKQPVQEVDAVASESVPENASVISSGEHIDADSNEMNMANLEGQLASIYFDFDKFAIRTDMKDTLAEDAKIAKESASKFTVKLEGNCDEWGSDEYNFALGLKRANSVKNALVAEGVDASNITMVSYGESNPVCKEKSQACWAKNRRVDFKLLP